MNTILSNIKLIRIKSSKFNIKLSYYYIIIIYLKCKILFLLVIVNIISILLQYYNI